MGFLSNLFGGSQDQDNDVTVVFEPFDDGQNRIYRGPMDANAEALMDNYIASDQGTCTTYTREGYPTYQHAPMFTEAENEEPESGGGWLSRLFG